MRFHGSRVQGMMDAMRGNGNGIDVVNMFTKSNTCGTTTTPDMAVPMCMSTFDRMTVKPQKHGSRSGS